MWGAKLNSLNCLCVCHCTCRDPFAFCGFLLGEEGWECSMKTIDATFASHLKVNDRVSCFLNQSHAHCLIIFMRLFPSDSHSRRRNANLGFIQAHESISCKCIIFSFIVMWIMYYSDVCLKGRARWHFGRLVRVIRRDCSSLERHIFHFHDISGSIFCEHRACQ